MKKSDLQLAIRVIQEQHKETMERAIANPKNDRVMGEVCGLSYALGVLSGVMDSIAKRRIKNEKRN